tara:strand:- start:315 stop:830 length:516 start_codon:yes stop_codon:yes gene_type:complete
MNLKELQDMIKEEFTSFINEQPGGPMGGPAAPGPAGPPMPSIDVAPGDVDAMEPPAGGPDGAEAQLQKIFGMLKSYFEGGEEGMEPEMDDMDNDADDMDVDAGTDEPTDVEPAEDDEETVDEAYGETTGGNAASNSGQYGGAYGATGEDKGNAQLHEGFKTRLQKLANIRK